MRLNVSVEIAMRKNCAHLARPFVGVLDPYNVEVVDYLKSVFVGTTQQRQPMTQDCPMVQSVAPQWEATESGREHARFLEEVLEMFPLPWYNGLTIFNVDFDDAIQKARMLLFKNIMAVPASGKWFKTGVALDEVFTQICFGDMFKLVLEEAFASTKLITTTTEWTVGDLSFVEDISYHVVASARIKQTLEWCRSSSTEVTIKEWAITKEPIRFLHQEFVRVSSDTWQREMLRPPLTDVCCRIHSPITLVIQYYSSLLTDTTGRRLQLLTKGRPIKEWKSEPETEAEAHQLRDAVFVVATWTKRRNEFLLEPPYTLASAVDDRLSHAEKQAQLAVFRTRPLCQLEPWLARPLGEMVRNSALGTTMFYFGFWLPFIAEWARRVRLGMGPIECKHGSGKQMSDSSMTFDTFSSLCVNREAMAVSEKVVAVAKVGNMPAAPLAAPKAARQKQRRVPTPLQMYHKQSIATENEMGIKVDPNSKQDYSNENMRAQEVKD